MKIKIEIKNSQRKITINKKIITHLAQQVLKVRGIERGELSILFVGKRHIQTLNKKFRNVDRPTDVLAFSMREGKDAYLHPEILGDVVICPEVAQRFAKIYKTPLQNEINLDLIHGILHLLGFQDSNPKSRRKIEKEQAVILEKITKKI